MEDNIRLFFGKVGKRADEAQRYNVMELVQQNLEEPDARHLMLLTKNNSALRLLFDARGKLHDAADGTSWSVAACQDPLRIPLDPPSRACTGALCHSLTPTLKSTLRRSMSMSEEPLTGA